MFTGIVEDRGTVVSAGEGRLVVSAPGWEDIRPGDSVSVSGVCLTVTGGSNGRMAFDLAPETLARSTLGSLRDGDPVNLERPVTLLTRLGGHLVQGHVDGTAAVEEVRPDGMMVIRPPKELERYVIEKGSIAVDGVSLTVAATREDGTFTVALVPHTMSVTTLGTKQSGDPVNLEVDVIAKYVEGMVKAQ